MKKRLLTLMTGILLLGSLTSCYRNVRTAEDITPGNPKEKLDWRYGSGDIRIQTSKINQQLMDRWFLKTEYQGERGKVRLVITDIDNCTDQYIPTDMIRDIFEGIAANDGRYTVVVGNRRDEHELDYMMDQIQMNPKYNNPSRLVHSNATAPEFLVKVRITKAKRADRFYDFEDYRMTVTLYDIETQEISDSAWDVLSKKVRRH